MMDWLEDTVFDVKQLQANCTHKLEGIVND